MAQFPSGAISKIEIVSPPKMQWMPFFVFVNNCVKVRRQCDAIWDGLSSLLLGLSPKCPTCNGVKSGLGAVSESGQNLSLLESPLPTALLLILLHFLIPTLSSVLLFLSRSGILCMQVRCLGRKRLSQSVSVCLI